MSSVSWESRFWSKVRKTSTCWLWTASKTSNGYGKMNIGGSILRAHRLSWLLHRGTIPPEQVVRHRCDVPSCVRPDHLRLGTKSQNNHDMVKRGRSTRGSGVQLTVPRVNRIRRLLQSGAVYADIAQRTGIPKIQVAVIDRLRVLGFG